MNNAAIFKPIKFRNLEVKNRIFRPWAVIRRRPFSLFADGFAIQYRQSIIDFGLRHGVPVVSG